MISRIRAFFGSVATKLALVLLIMGIMTGTATFVAQLVFARTVAELNAMSHEKLPGMTTSSKLIIDTNAIKDGIAAILIATSEAELDSLAGGIDGQLELLEFNLADTNPDSRTVLETQISSLRLAVDGLLQARSTEFSGAEQIVVHIKEMEALAEVIAQRVEELTGDAVQALNVGSKETVARVDSTLQGIVDVNVEGLRLVLQVRAEINLMSGLIVAYAETQDQALVSIIRDLGEASHERLDEALVGIGAIETLAIDTGELRKTSDFFREVQSNSSASANRRRNEVLEARQKSDAALASIIDDLIFELTIESADATEANGKAISGLLSGEVEGLRRLARLESALNHVLAKTFSVASVRESSTLSEEEAKLRVSTALLAEIVTNAPEDVRKPINAFLELSAGENGIAALQEQVFANRKAAVEAAQLAAKNVLDTSNTAAAVGAAVAEDIVQSAKTLEDHANTAHGWMTIIAVGGLVVLAFAMLLTMMSVIRPILALCRTTERLAAGDLGEVTGFDRYAGEIGRMARALRVFRDGLVEKQQLEQEEVERKEREAQDERHAEQRRVTKEAEEQERAAAEERAIAVRDAKEAKEREELRQAAEEERRQRAEEQDNVVSALAIGLKKLSDGDLDAEIVNEFPGTYEKLRLDFNHAIETLSELIGEMASEGTSIDLSLAEMSSAAESLAKRTEQSAAQLQETAASIDTLTDAVKSAAEDSVSADASAMNASQRAEHGREIIDSAIAAMKKIESSSDGITKVTDLIDDIALQTNLLALNASVEAARAGDAGRGFAVVASEVRELARRSAEAAKQIDTLLDESQRNVALGSELVAKTGQALESISSSATETNDMVVRIKNASQEQAGSIAEINTAVTALDRATQENAAMFEETSSLATTLSVSSSNLAQAIARFKVPPQRSSSIGVESAKVRDVSANNSDALPVGRSSVRVASGGQAVVVDSYGEWDEF